MRHLPLAAIFSWGAAVSSAAFTPAFFTPRADPSFAEFSPAITNYPDLTQPLAAFVETTNCSAYTFLAWLKSRDYPRVQYGNLGVDVMFSATASRSTSEGGPELTAFYDSGMVTASDYDAVQVVWPGDSAAESRPGGIYPLGVYCIAVTNAGAEDFDLQLPDDRGVYNVPANTEYVFNYAPQEGDDGVFRMYNNSSVVYRFRAARQPVVQFMRRELWNYDPFDSSAFTNRAEHFLGVNPDEYQMLVFRARVLTPQSVESCLDALAWDREYWGGAVSGSGAVTPRVTNTLDTALSSTNFEQHASARLYLGSLYGAYLAQTNAIHTYGAKMIPRWLSNGDLKLIRDCDVAEMRRRGVAFGVYSNNWDLVYTQKTSGSVITGTVENLTESVGGASYTRQYLQATNTYTVMMGVNNVPAADPSTYLTADQLTYYAPGAISVASNEIAYPVNGTYTVTGTAPNGGSRQATVLIYPGPTSRKTITYANSAGKAGEMTWQVLYALDGAPTPTATNTYDGKATQEWRIRRIPALPVKTYRGSDTRGCVYMGALSPHTYFTAWHWRWWYSGREEWTDATNGIHAAVTDYGSVVRLVDWAAAQGVPTNGIAEHCGDIAVGVFSSGTVPYELCPYLMSTNTAARLFGTAPVLGWSGTQTARGYALPILLNPYISSPALSPAPFRTWTAPRGLASVSSSKTVPATAPDALTGLLDAYSLGFYAEWFRDALLAPVYGGDSGIGVFLDALDGNGGVILVSHFTTTTSGPSYVLAYPLLKAWIEAHGDEVKEWRGE